MEYTYLVYTMRFSLSVVVFHSFNTQLLIVCKFETLQCEESEYGVNVYFECASPAIMHTLRGWTGIVSVYLHLIGVRKKRGCGREGCSSALVVCVGMAEVFGENECEYSCWVGM